MSTSVQLKLKAVDDLLARTLPMLNDVASSAYFIQQGSLQFSKHRKVEAELTQWLAQNRGILPGDVTSAVARLNHRIAEWAMSGAVGATPQDFATDDRNSFSEVNRLLDECKVKLLSELDNSEQAMRIGVAKSMRGPWVSGSFYLFAAVVLVSLLAVVVNVIPLWSFPLIAVAGLILLLVVGGMQLKQDDRLTDKAFIQLMGMAFRSIPFLFRGEQQR